MVTKRIVKLIPSTLASLMVIVCLSTILVLSCASLTGVTKWKESWYSTSVSPDSAYTIATRALASSGKVAFADKATLTVSGECAQQVDAAISISQRDGMTVVLLKSKLNVKGSSMVIETGDRANCIKAIANQIRSQGLELVEIR